MCVYLLGSDDGASASLVCLSRNNKDRVHHCVC